MPRRPVRTLPTPEVLIAGPFRGMRDAPEPTASDPGLALYAGNMCRQPGPPNSGLISRPGFGAMGSVLTGTCQAILTWTMVSGTRITTAIVNGKVYSYNWSTTTWSEVVTAADLSGKAITLSSSARVALVPFADGVVVSDGTNTPWHWTGASGAGGLTKLTNAPAFYGPPVVYYSKLIGIKASDRSTMVWSEEGQPNTGYEAGGYNNAWDNPGGYADPMTSLAATNEALYVFRERVALAITGAVTSDWATAGTRSNVSEDIGTLSPWATTTTADGVLIVDADAMPWLVQLGQSPRPIWTDCRQTMRGTPRAVLSEIQTVQDDSTYSYLIGYPEVGQTVISAFLCYAQDDWQFCGVWSWGEGTQRIGMVVDGNGVARWAHGGASDTRLYVHGDLESGPWNDALASGTRYIDHAVVSAPLGYDLDRELIVDQLEAAVTGTGVSSVTVSYETPRGPGTAMTASLNGGGGFSWDVDDWDVGNWAVVTRDQKVLVGTRARGRWIRVALRHSAANEPFGVTVMRVRATALQGNPSSP